MAVILKSKSTIVSEGETVPIDHNFYFRGY